MNSGQRIADLDAFWAEAAEDEPTSAVYLHTYADGRLSMWAEGDRMTAIKAMLRAEQVIVECESDGELH